MDITYYSNAPLKTLQSLKEAFDQAAQTTKNYRSYFSSLSTVTNKSIAALEENNTSDAYEALRCLHVICCEEEAREIISKVAKDIHPFP